MDGEFDMLTPEVEVIRPLILVVDDDLRATRALARMLREDGFDVEVCADGATAIGRLTRSPAPDALVTDFRMPHADGLAVARFARLRRPDLPIVLVSSYADGSWPSEGELAPPARVISKPIDYEVFSAALREIVVTARAASARPVR